jgi:hypothetical protein
LKLPDAIGQDQAKQIVATAQVPPYEGTTHVVAITDTNTGTSEIVAKQEPLPLFAFRNDKELGMRAGISGQGYAGALYGRWTFARVGRFHISGYGEVQTNAHMRSDAKIQLEASYRW